MNVVFDIGGVLLDWSPQRLLAQHGADVALAEALFRHKRWYQLDAGTATRAEYETEVAAALDLERSWLSGLLDAMPHSLEPIPEVVALMRRLDEAGVPLFVLSNMPGFVSEVVLRKHDFLRLAREPVFSFEAQVNKPDAQIYRHFLARTGLSAERCLFIDDSLPNITAARAQGWQALHLPDCSPAAVSALTDSLVAAGVPARG